MLGTASSPTYGGAFWNVQSGDGPTNNIGWCLAGGGGCGLAGAPGSLSYYGTGTGNVSNMWFSSSSGSLVTVSLQGIFTNETTAANGIDYFGYYTLDSNGNVTGMSQLFSAGSGSVGTKIFAVSPGQSYGFYIENVEGQGTPFETDYYYMMDSGDDYSNVSNATIQSLQHVAVFDENANTYYLGAEDSFPGLGDGDFNDMILEVSAVATPEPVTVALAGMGLVGLGAFARRRRGQDN